MARRRILLSQRVVTTSRGERRDTLDQRWTDLAARLDALLIPLPNRADPLAVVEDVNPVLVVLSGGNDLAALPGANDPAPERDRTEAALVTHALDTGRPLLGVCRGMQLLVHHLGGRLERVDGHVGAPHQVWRSTTTRWPLPEYRVVNSYHHWGVTSHEGNLPNTLEMLAHGDDGTVEAVAHRSRPIVGVMWHPERPPVDDADHALISAIMEAH